MMTSIEHPRAISVIVPAYNEAAVLHHLFTALNRQTLAKESFDIVIVDNASTDTTYATIENLQKNFPELTIKILSESRKGVGFARDTAWRNTSAPVLASTDADCRPHPTWLEDGLAYFENHPETVCVSGLYLYYDASVLFCFFATLFQKYVMIPAHYTAQKCGIGAISIGGNSFFLRKNVVAINGYDPKISSGYGEDIEIASRLIKQGRVDYTAKITMHSSARRFSRVGFLTLPFTYAANAFSLWFYKKPLDKEFRDQ